MLGPMLGRVKELGYIEYGLMSAKEQTQLNQWLAQHGEYPGNVIAIRVSTDAARVRFLKLQRWTTGEPMTEVNAEGKHVPMTFEHEVPLKSVPPCPRRWTEHVPNPVGSEAGGIIPVPAVAKTYNSDGKLVEVITEGE